MRAKILRASALRLVLGGAGLCALVAAGTPISAIQGRLTLLDKGDRQAEDVGQAVLWLATPARVSVPPVQAEINTADKQFSPHVLVVPVGSTVTFPNHDPFNHNVFSLSEENPFDLGMYGRGETRSTEFPRAGIIRIYCNVHPQMSALVVVRDNPYYTQPSSDGSFTIPDVPPGKYVLHAWHERAVVSRDLLVPATREIQVPGGGVSDLELTLDARGYKFKPHLNKFGRPYPQQGRRY